MESCRVYGVADMPPGALAGEAVAVLGYGHLGRTVALNLRDSGVKVRIGNRQDEYADQARADGFEVVPLAVAAADDIVWVLLPDEVIPEVFAREIVPALRRGGAVAFGSGYSLAFDLVRPPETVDVLLVAPRMAGVSARARYLAGEGFWACVGVEADRSGRARQRMLGLADAHRRAAPGAVEMSAATEATLDLFIEQTIGPLLGTAIMVAFEVGREAGIAPEALVLEMYMSGEMETVFRSFREIGFFRASEDHGPDGRLRRDHAHPRAGPGRDRGALPGGARGHPQRRVRPPVPGGGRQRLPDARHRPGHDARRLADQRGREAPPDAWRGRLSLPPVRRAPAPRHATPAPAPDTRACSRPGAVFVHRHRWAVLILSVLSSGTSLWLVSHGGRFDSAPSSSPSTESGRALALMNRDLPQRPLAFRPHLRPPDAAGHRPGLPAEVERALAPLRGHPRVAAVRTAWDVRPPEPERLSRDGHHTRVSVELTGHTARRRVHDLRRRRGRDLFRAPAARALGRRSR